MDSPLVTEYKPTVWIKGADITAERLNKIENQLEAVSHVAKNAIRYDVAITDMSAEQKQNLASNLGIEPMQGATFTLDGTAGLVPAPNKLSSNYYLRGDGTWDNVRDMIGNAYQTRWAPENDGTNPVYADGPTGIALPNDMASNVPLRLINVELPYGNGATYETMTLRFTMFGFMDIGTFTINFVELTGSAYNGSHVVQIEPSTNHVVIGGIGYDVPIDIPYQTFGTTIKCDQAGSRLQIIYRVDPTAVFNRLEARVAALENASGSN